MSRCIMLKHLVYSLAPLPYMGMHSLICCKFSGFKQNPVNSQVIFGIHARTRQGELSCTGGGGWVKMLHREDAIVFLHFNSKHLHWPSYGSKVETRKRKKKLVNFLTFFVTTCLCKYCWMWRDRRWIIRSDARGSVYWNTDNVNVIGKQTKKNQSAM